MRQPSCLVRSATRWGRWLFAAILYLLSPRVGACSLSKLCTKYPCLDDPPHRREHALTTRGLAYFFRLLSQHKVSGQEKLVHTKLKAPQPIIYYITQWGWGEQGQKGDLICRRVHRCRDSQSSSLYTEHRGVSVARTAAEALYWMEANSQPHSTPILVVAINMLVSRSVHHAKQGYHKLIVPNFCALTERGAHQRQSG